MDNNITNKYIYLRFCRRTLFFCTDIKKISIAGEQAWDSFTVPPPPPTNTWQRRERRVFGMVVGRGARGHGELYGARGGRGNTLLWEEKRRGDVTRGESRGAGDTRPLSPRAAGAARSAQGLDSASPRLRRLLRESECARPAITACAIPHCLRCSPDLESAVLRRPHFENGLTGL